MARASRRMAASLSQSVAMVRDAALRAPPHHEVERVGTLRLSAAGELEPLVERRIAAHRRRHQEPIALVEDAFHVVAVDMRVADRHVVLLAGIDHARHPLEYFRVLVLARKPKLLREVALADQDRADAGHL